MLKSKITIIATALISVALSACGSDYTDDFSKYLNKDSEAPVNNDTAQSDSVSNIDSTVTTTYSAYGNGMNIGNTLDSYGDWITGTTPKDFETAWGNPQITTQLIATYKAAGVKVLRLPVTWRQHIDDNGNIDPVWMARIKEVVDYIINEDMYCILNVHHDCGGDENAWLRADQNTENLSKIEGKFKGLWTNIANEFNNYGDKLIFEGYNEMLDGSLHWTSTDAEGYAALNKLAQDFVDVVRATGGNNATRNLIVNTYGGDAHQLTLSQFNLPEDSATGHLIVGMHVYTPDEFVAPASADEAKTWKKSYASQLDNTFSLIDQYFVSKDIPVIISEFGCNGNVPESEQVKYTNYFVSKAKELGISCLYWFDLIDRSDNTWKLPNVVNELMK